MFGLLDDRREAYDPEKINEDHCNDYSQINVLVVDDNFFSSIAVVNLLQQYQLESHLATDGQEAFEMVKRRFERSGTTYKLIIMDVYMPICDGFTSTEMIRKYLKEQDDLGFSIEEPPYICFLTAQFQKVSQKGFSDEQVNCLLTKPIFKTGIL